MTPTVPTAPAAARRLVRPPLALLVAVRFEARGLGRRLGWPVDPPGEAPAPVTVHTVGLRAAGLPRLAPVLAARRPAALLVAGLAGGCAPDLAPGDLLVAERVGLAATGAWWAAPAELLARAAATREALGLPGRVGRLLTLDDVAATPAAKRACWRDHGADAVDLESARLAAWAATAGVPALAVRAVADGPGEPLPPSLPAAVGPDGAVRPLALLGWLAAPPRLLAAWRLWRRASLALDRLARFLGGFAADAP